MRRAEWIIWQGVRMAAEYDAKPVFLGIFGEDRGIWYHFKEQSEYLYEH